MVPDLLPDVVSDLKPHLIFDLVPGCDAKSATISGAKYGTRVGAICGTGVRILTQTVYHRSRIDLVVPNIVQIGCQSTHQSSNWISGKFWHSILNQIWCHSGTRSVTINIDVWAKGCMYSMQGELEG